MFAKLNNRFDLISLVSMLLTVYINLHCTFSEIKLDKDALIQEEISRIPPLQPSHLLVHLPTECQWESGIFL